MERITATYYIETPLHVEAAAAAGSILANYWRKRPVVENEAGSKKYEIRSTKPKVSTGH